MFGIKYRFETIPFYNCQAIAHRLEEMAAKGWMIEKISDYIYRYRKATPAQLRFAVTYFPENTNYELYPTPQQEHYLEICRAAGWKPVFLHNQLQVLCNEDVNRVDIYTDGATQLDRIHKTSVKSFVPQQLIGVLIAVIQLFSAVTRFDSDPMTFIAQPVNLLLPLFFVIHGLMSVIYLTEYFIWHRKCRQYVEATGEFLHPEKRSLTVKAVQFVNIVAWLVLMLIYTSARYRKYLIAALVVIAVSFAVPRFFKRDALSMGKTAEDVGLITAVTCVIAVLVSVGFVTGGITSGADYSREQAYYTEKYNLSYYEDTNIVPYRTIPLQEINRYPQLITLTMQDYNPYITTEGEIKYRIVADTWLVYSVVVHKVGYTQLTYTTYYPDKIVSGLALHGLKNQLPAGYSLTEIDATPWHADKVWQMNTDKGYFAGRYLIRYPDRITSLSLGNSNTLTDRQLQTIAEKLSAQSL